MTAAFEASDQDGAWLWKDAYEASEAAAVLFLRKYGPGMLKKAGSAARYLSMIERLAALLPSHMRRSEESEQFQQFSTPLGLGYLMSLAAHLSPQQVVLEPSAGTGLLAIHAEIAGATLILNELAETRGAMLSALFPQAPVTRFNAEQIDDYLDAAIEPGTVLMNPPFSASPGIDRSMRDAISARPCAVCRRVDASSSSQPQRMIPRTRMSKRFTPIFQTVRPSRSPPPPTAASMRAMARASIQGSRLSTGFRHRQALLLPRPVMRKASPSCSR